jgi:hypothetical protein
MIDINKKYKLRNGSEAIVYAVYNDNNSHWNVHGAYKNKGKWQVASWDITGRISSIEDSVNDLIEVSPYADFKIDDKVLVWDYSGETKLTAHFAGVNKNGIPMIWDGRRTSFTEKHKIAFKNCEKYEEQNDKT